MLCKNGNMYVNKINGCIWKLKMKIGDPPKYKMIQTNTEKQTKSAILTKSKNIDDDIIHNLF